MILILWHSLNVSCIWGIHFAFNVIIRILPGFLLLLTLPACEMR
jgi:hypothetical protein